ncbi:hypothetical protein RF55_12603 [Lasius niger]|uniref:Reverse transcriptase Ty1/copia-type domain-containing protein n=1 Tax=Lasius niger TaxID=67767 RepID=A0A0J7KCQ0_LASNI|nr:hypothetical protein RF55_12603 [Lasius niger]
MGIYVDDGILIADESTEIEAILKELNTEFKMSVIKKPKTFVELEINKEDKRVKLTQVDYIKRTLEQYGMENAKPVKTPILKGEDTRTTPTTKDFPYRQLIESLLYLSTKKRPDISFAVNFGSRTSIVRDSAIMVDDQKDLLIEQLTIIASVKQVLINFKKIGEANVTQYKAKKRLENLERYGKSATGSTSGFFRWRRPKSNVPSDISPRMSSSPSKMTTTTADHLADIIGKLAHGNPNTADSVSNASLREYSGAVSLQNVVHARVTSGICNEINQALIRHDEIREFMTLRIQGLTDHSKQDVSVNKNIKAPIAPL